MDLLVLVGERCERFMEHAIKDVPVEDVQADEIWGFVGCKRRTQKRLNKGEEFGDAYCFTAVERRTKLLLVWHLGKRSGDDTMRFAGELKNATTGRFQLTTDGYREYQFAMPAAFARIDFAQLVKIFGGVRSNEAALAMFFCYYNFCRVHITLKTTPAVASGLTDHVWSVKEMLEAIAAWTCVSVR